MQPHGLVLHVQPHDRGWSVRRLGHQQPAMILNDKESAFAHALDWARAYPPSRVVLHAGDGGVETHRDFGPDMWPPNKDRYYYYDPDFESRDHETEFSLPHVNDTGGS